MRTTEAIERWFDRIAGSDPGRAEGAAPEGRRAGCPEQSTSLHQLQVETTFAEVDENHRSDREMVDPVGTPIGAVQADRSGAGVVQW